MKSPSGSGVHNPSDPLTAALANMTAIREAIDHAPPGHNALGCEALGDAEDAIFHAAAMIDETTECPHCLTVRALGSAGVLLGFLPPSADPEDDVSEWAHEVCGDLLEAIYLSWPQAPEAAGGAQ